VIDMRLIVSLLVIGVLAASAIVAGEAARSSTWVKLRDFHDWTVQVHWTNSIDKQVIVLLDEVAVEGRDTTCEAVLSMLDKLTSIIPRSWTVKLVSPTGWVPAPWNPIDRDGVEWMLKDVASIATDPDHDQLDPDAQVVHYYQPPPSHMFSHRTANAH